MRFSEFRATLRTFKEPYEQRSTPRLCLLHLPSFSGFTDLCTTLWTFRQIEHTSQYKTRRTNVLTSGFFFDDLHYRETVHIRIAWDSAKTFRLPTFVQRVSKERIARRKTQSDSVRSGGLRHSWSWVRTIGPPYTRDYLNRNELLLFRVACICRKSS